MAEIFGIAAGVAGFVSLLTQIISGIDTLREINAHANKAPAELSALLSELTVLKSLIDEVINRAPPNDDWYLQLCRSSIETVVIGLEKLKKRMNAWNQGTRKLKARKIFAFRHWKEDVEVLQRDIQVVKLDLLLCLLPTLNLNPSIQVARTSHIRSS
ncbi:hypothetical protein LSUE1_G007086 [Lachnellula suecica]|uniref:Fungal N-terminal domain-containing protein n=1 Tax=Lachnellula suecica TaxID=602035 RepID=A0A8T9C4P0_9HELO|nr:hypothetical protein LSUE1_G007086 [Lachnellula suecica]